MYICQLQFVISFQVINRLANWCCHRGNGQTRQSKSAVDNMFQIFMQLYQCYTLNPWTAKIEQPACCASRIE